MNNTDTPRTAADVHEVLNQGIESLFDSYMQRSPHKKKWTK